jgi:hypothetical protein
MQRGENLVFYDQNFHGSSGMNLLVAVETRKL